MHAAESTAVIKKYVPSKSDGSHLADVEEQRKKIL
jgi:hypothetical protein